MKKLTFTFFLFLLPVLLLLSPTSVNAQIVPLPYEKINSYSSVIDIQNERSLLVREIINVTALGYDIKRGIYRDFPTDYKDEKGKIYKVGFEVISVKKDGVSEPYHTESESNGVRLYIGDKDTYLKHGDYTYEIYFKTTKQLGIFDTHDELYFNAIGTGWTFPVLKGKAEVILPDKFSDSDIQYESYTGAQGSRENNTTARIDNTGNRSKIIFSTIIILPEYSGLTVVVGWPKGHVNYQTAAELAMEAFLENLYIYFGIIGLLFVLAYYLFAWFRFGKDPSGGVVIPEYTIPDSNSPGIVSFVDKMGYDNVSLTSNIVNLARKKVVKITESGKTYKIELIKEESIDLTEEENFIVETIKKEGNKILSFSGTYSVKISTFLSNYKVKIEELSKKYISHNDKWKVIGVLLSFSIIFLTICLYGINRDIEETIPILTGSGVLFFIFGVFPGLVFNETKKSSKGNNILVKIFSGCFFFFIACVTISFAFFLISTTGLGIGTFFAFIFLSAINFVGIITLASRTKEGRSLQDKIEGLKMYIKTAETARLKFLYKTFEDAVQNYEKILPYAIALGLELEWSEKFSKLFDMFKEETGNVYISPIWFIGSSHGFNANSFTSGLSSTIASSSVRPGSSSGFSGGGGGGGFSGGGGGGGGGGGW